MAGRGEERPVVVDTDKPMKWVLRLGEREDSGDIPEQDGV